MPEPIAIDESAQALFAGQGENLPKNCSSAETTEILNVVVEVVKQLFADNEDLANELGLTMEMINEAAANLKLQLARRCTNQVQKNEGTTFDIEVYDGTAMRQLAVNWNFDAISAQLPAFDGDEMVDMTKLDYLMNPSTWENFDLSILREMIPNIDDIIDDVKDALPPSAKPVTAPVPGPSGGSPSPSGDAPSGDSSGAASLFAGAGLLVAMLMGLMM